jgi:subtilisin family serine protease
MAAWRWVRRRVAVLCVVVVAGGVVPAPASADPAFAAASGRAVTLVTGDRVRVVEGAHVIEPGAGRERMAFDVRTVRGHLTVTPADALRAVSSGQVDRRLFDVTALLDMGYGDDKRSTLPLLVPRGARVAAGRAGRDLPAIGLTAMTAAKPDAAAVWAGLLNSGQRVWLDARRTISLDRSVPQIGAPAAWAAGYTGRGVTVAVLDTGIDASHPDFAGRLAGTMNFTDEPEAGDIVGHGTHVASILAGSGAASAGRYRGVAPDASLLAGKVCTWDGCPDSAILAGMQWAAASGASVVNLSLGGPDSAELDPVEAAIGTLTARYGTLFVAAAGNRGEAGPSTIDSPASADAALAVAAVDGHDQLAPFSGRGPRAGHGMIKPDLSAPGVDIVAARADGTQSGEPVDDRYVRLSGTSMATPHAAGAAALLVQQHPGWRAMELKAALMGAATPNPQADAYAQGNGRLDVAAATARALRADPPSVDLGVQRWPHQDDAPASRAVTLYNDGPATARLAVTLAVAVPGGGPAPAGMFAVSPSEVTVPPGGSAAVTITADTARTGPEGVYFGHMMAGPVRVAFTVDRERESYDLSLTHLNRDGAATGNYSTSLDGIADPVEHLPYEPDGTITLRLPKGRYHLDSTLSTARSNHMELTKIIQSEVDMSRDVNVVLDARAARPVAVTVTRPGADVLGAAVGYRRTLPSGVELSASMFSFGQDPLSTAHIGSPAPVAGLVGRVLSWWGVRGPDGRLGDGSHLYTLAFYPKGRLPTGYQRRVRDDELAQVRAEHRGGPDEVAEKTTRSSIDGVTESLSLGTAFTLPATRTEYYTTGGVRWSSTTLSTSRWFQSSAPTSYPRGASVESWNAAPFGPGLAAAGPGGWINRTGDRIAASPPLFSDRTTSHSGFTGNVTTSLSRNGQSVPSDGSGFSVPPETASYELVAESVRGTELSSRVTVAWTFRSGHVNGSDPAPLPVSVVRFAPALDAHDAAPAGRAFTIPITVQRQTQGAGAGSTVASIAVDVSYDDGATWLPATVDQRRPQWTATVSHPDSAGFVSLRAHMVDRSGETVQQTVIRAYRLAR